jgi:Asp-tRNA(Asn)/Glu-tRNA(Gln) amidotransferase A subunit family amidase
MTIAPMSRYDATTALKKIACGTFTATDYLKACLDRIAEREEDVGAFTHLAAPRALVQASDVDARPFSGTLHGIPIAIKDIIDTHDMPTEHGSPIYKGSIPVSDAACVAMLRLAGAIVLGKTVTPEFAAVTPGRTANPHNLKHTPGGSSSGSAAAVADFMVPVAIGTQTVGSTIRPASYCGVVGYMPSHPRIGQFLPSNSPVPWLTNIKRTAIV